MTTEPDKRKTFYKPVLSPSEQHIFRFILQHSDQVRGMPIRQLADLSCTSTTTIMRMAKKFGYPGYSDFRDGLNHVSDDGGGLLSGISQYDLDYFFSETVRSRHFSDALNKASVIIERCDTILFTGDHEGKNLIDLACRLFAQTGMNTGRVSSYDRKTDPRKTCAVFILGSQGGSSLDVLCSALDKSGISTIAVAAGSCCVLSECCQTITCGLSRGSEDCCGSVIPVVYVLEELRKKLPECR